MTHPTTGWKRDLRCGALLGVSVLVPVAILSPVALRLSSGVLTPRSATVCVLLLEAAYLLMSSTLLGVFATRARRLAMAAAVPLLVATSLLGVACLSGADIPSIAAAQPAALGVFILGVGVGRASLYLCRRFAPATAMALMTILVLGGNLLVVSHLAPALSARPWVSGLLLSLNPFVVVTSGGGYDLIRGSGLYDLLTLSAYRFQYPDPVWGPLLMAAVGLLLGASAFFKKPGVFNHA